jgi:hypothetical protein
MIMLETAPLIEGDGLVPAVPSAQMALLAAGDGALEAALRGFGAGAAPAAAEARGELLFDLFVDARSGYRAEGAGRSAEDILATTSWRGWLIGDDSDNGSLGLDGGSIKDPALRAAFSDVDGDGKEDEPIVVKGDRKVDDGSGGDTGGGYGDGSYPGGPGGPQPGDGGSTLQPDPSPDLSHTQTCSTADGAAKQIGDAIKNAPAVPGRGDWTKVEYATFVVRSPDGRFGALESTIYTDNQVAGAIIPNVWGDDYAEGVIHNHPDAIGGAVTDLINRYPAAGDWAVAQTLYNAYSPHYPGYDPSVWIIDSAGVLREFKFSERSAIEGLSESQKQAGEGLEGRERTNSCS